MNAAPVYQDVPGAPVRIGQRVRVIGVDAMGLPEFVGQSGVVEYLEYSCGCGQVFPGDPMIGVRFVGGAMEEFWREELGQWVDKEQGEEV